MNSRFRSFLRGMAHAFDLFGALGPRLERTPSANIEAEAWEALRGDWEAVGGDLKRAIERFEAENPEVVAEARRRQRDGSE